MRVSSYIPALAMLTGAALLCLAAAMLSVAHIETSSHRAVSRALLVNGHDWADVTVDGLIVTMTGTAPDEAMRFQALTAAGTAVDDSRVIDEITVAAAKAIAPPRFSIEILRNTSGVSLIGLVPAAMDRAEMADRVTTLSSGAPVTDLLESADYPVPAGWADALDFAFDVLGRLPRSKISVAADRVEITSVAESGPMRRMLETQLTRNAPRDIDLVLNISAPRPVISPFTLRFVIDDEDGARFDACSAYTETGRDRILAAAQAAGMTGSSECVLGLGVPTPRWADAVTVALEGLSQLGGGSVTFSDADISLIAPETTDQAVFDQVVGTLEARLPDVFALTATKPQPIQVDGSNASADKGPPEFVARLTEDGMLHLRGRVGDERQRLAVNGFAMARFAKADVAPAMRLDEELPDGWAARVFAGLEALSTLSDGTLVVQPDFMDIRGHTGNTNSRAEISRILSAQLGEKAVFRINVTYDERLDPLVSIPTPEDCIASINAILEAQKITFEPGSADIDGAGLGTIDKIAEVLADCSDVPMEIAGHTDSQGRESMNLDLSQQRAEAVLAALRERRVLTGRLRPTGYGEANPIADNGTDAGREANRRIEFTLLQIETEESDSDPTPNPETEGEAEVAPETEVATEAEGTPETERDPDFEARLEAKGEVTPTARPETLEVETGEDAGAEAEGEEDDEQN